MRIGLLGGTFDPPHNAHLLLADCAFESLKLDKILFIPAAISPFKTSSSTSSPENRCEMVALAIHDNPGFALDTCEVERGGVSYTVDTVRTLHAKYPDDDLVLLMGADAFADFPSWHAPEKIVGHVSIGVAQRPGTLLDLGSHPFGSRAQVFPVPQFDISASDIRKRVQSGQSIRYLVPWTVRTFIEAKRLYHSG